MFPKHNFARIIATRSVEIEFIEPKLIELVELMDPNIEQLVVDDAI